MAACAAALAAGALAGLLAVGARAYVIESPSMGSAAPVGSLVVALATEPASLRTGDVVAFRPPEPGAAVHVHRVVEDAPGAVRTRGDLNAADDAWPLTAATLLGRVQWVLPGAGWAVRALPLVVLAVLASTRGARRLPRAHRGPARLAVASAALLATSALLHPWTGAVPLAAAPGDGAGLRVVSTGLLPQRVVAVTAGDGARAVGAAVVRYGSTATITVPQRYHDVPLRLRTRWDPTGTWSR